MNRVGCFKVAICCFLLTAVWFTPVQAAKRVALVIGNSSYEHASILTNPRNDAKAVSAAFKRIGFDSVTLRMDLGATAMQQALREFDDAAVGADAAVIFYAGHGLELSGENYLVPIDAKLRRDRHLNYEAIKLSALLHAVAGAKGLRLVILDACRNNPFAAQMRLSRGATRSVARGFGRTEPTGDILVAYSARHGTTAYDGDRSHSPYTKALLAHIAEPGIDVRLVFGKVRDSVKASTSGRQVPHIYGTLGGRNVYLVPPKAGEIQANTPRPTYPQYDPKAAGLEFWQSIRGSKNAALYQDYLRRYPQGEFSVIAKAKLDGLQLVESKPKEEEIAALPNVESAESSQLQYADRRELTLLLQKELKRVGCNPGAIDGHWGAKGRRALARFNKYANLALPTAAPTPRSIEAVKKKTSRVCAISPHSDKTIDAKITKNNKSKKNNINAIRAACISTVKRYCKKYESSCSVVLGGCYGGDYDAIKKYGNARFWQ